MGVIKDYNGANIKQTSHYIEMSCENYVHHLSKTHRWEPSNVQDSSPDTAAASIETLTPENNPLLLQHKDPSHVPLSSDILPYCSSNCIVPIPSYSIERMYKETGPKEGVVAHKVLKDKMGLLITLFLVN